VDRERTRVSNLRSASAPRKNVCVSVREVMDPYTAFTFSGTTVIPRNGANLSGSLYSLEAVVGSDPSVVKYMTAPGIDAVIATSTLSVKKCPVSERAS
jgi:hypothetical protein